MKQVTQDQGLAQRITKAAVTRVYNTEISNKKRLRTDSLRGVCKGKAFVLGCNIIGAQPEQSLFHARSPTFPKKHKQNQLSLSTSLKVMQTLRVLGLASIGKKQLISIDNNIATYTMLHNSTNVLCKGPSGSSVVKGVCLIDKKAKRHICRYFKIM